MANEFVTEINEGNFEEKVIKADKPMLIDFWAPWCGPCRMVGPMVESVAAKVAGKAYVGKVNVDENPALAQKFGVMSIPTLLVFHDGKDVERSVGARGEKALEGMLTNHMK